MRQWGIWIGLGITAVCLYGLILVTGALAMAAAGKPEDVARDFNAAIAAKDLAKAREYLCDARKDDFLRPEIFAIGSREPIDVRYELIDSDGDNARVREVGTVRVTLGGIITASRVDNTMIFRREDGRWRYCPSKT